MKIKSLLDKFSGEIKNTCLMYSVTASLIILISILSALVIDQKDQTHIFVINKLIPFFVIMGPGTFLAETLFFTQKRYRWISIFLVTVVSAVFVFLVNQKADLFWNIMLSPDEYKLPRFVLTWWIVLFVLGIYANFRKSGLRFSHYTISVFHNLTKTGIVSVVLSAGLMMVSLIFITLILDGSNYSTIVRLETILNGCVIGIGILSSLSNTKQEISRFFSIIVKYILVILTIIAFAIIYLYIARILITGIVPSNEIFRIVAALFIIGLPIWTMAGYFSADNLLIKISRKLPYIFIPFLGLQGYSIGIRIAEYGLTPFRYLCVMLMIFEIVYIIGYWIKKGEIGSILPFFAACTVIALSLPGINMFSSSIRDQKLYLERYSAVSFDEFTPEEQRRFAGAYFFLQDNVDGKQYIEELSPEQIAAIENSSQYREINGQQRSIYKQLDLSEIDITGFRKMSRVNTYSYLEPVDISAVDFTDTQKNIVVTADMTHFVQEYLAADQKNEIETAKLPNSVVIGDGSVIYFYYVSLITDSDGEISELNLEGIWLQK
ncbi:MAG: hypothetical protein AB9907_02215 [Flexilinea sp.]